MTRWEQILEAFVLREPPPDGYRTCTLCRATLPLTNFYRNEHKWTTRCKPCYKQLVKERSNEKKSIQPRQVH